MSTFLCERRFAENNHLPSQTLSLFWESNEVQTKTNVCTMCITYIGTHIGFNNEHHYFRNFVRLNEGVFK